MLRYRRYFRMSYADVEELVLNRPDVFYRDLEMIDAEHNVMQWATTSNVIQSKK